MHSVHAVAIAVSIFAIAVAYLLPTMLAAHRECKGLSGISETNLLFGWTLAGYGWPRWGMGSSRRRKRKSREPRIGNRPPIEGKRRAEMIDALGETVPKITMAALKQR